METKSRGMIAYIKCKSVIYLLHYNYVILHVRNLNHLSAFLINTITLSSDDGITLCHQEYYQKPRRRTRRRSYTPTEQETNLSGESDGVSPSPKVSFHHLPTVNMGKCPAACSRDLH